jgi:hypothetical protein
VAIGRQATLAGYSVLFGAAPSLVAQRRRAHDGVLRATPNASNGDLSEHHACDFGSGRSAKIEKHLSAPLGVKNCFAQ